MAYVPNRISGGREEAYMRSRFVLSAALAIPLAIAGTAVAATATPVMSGLDNPRGLAFARNGAL